eukprot:2564395-Prymnesium_polylepis.1
MTGQVDTPPWSFAVNSVLHGAPPAPPRSPTAALRRVCTPDLLSRQEYIRAAFSEDIRAHDSGAAGGVLRGTACVERRRGAPHDGAAVAARHRASGVADSQHHACSA